MNLGLVKWLLGFPDQALQLAAQAVHTATATGHPFDHAVALAWGSTVHCLAGRSTSIHSMVETFLAITVDSRISGWHERARFFEAILRHDSAAEKAAELPAIVAAIDAVWESGARLQTTWMLGATAERCLLSMDLAPAQQYLSLAFQHARDNEERYAEPELYRLAGELAFAASAGSGDEAERHFREGIALAQSQRAVGWGLRLATSQSRLLRRQGEVERSRAVIAAACDRFTEGFGAADFVTARALVE